MSGILAAENLLQQLNVERALRLDAERSLRTALKETRRLNGLLCTDTHWLLSIPKPRWSVLVATAGRLAARAAGAARWAAGAAWESLWPSEDAEEHVS
jgi:hypothetical protein